MRRKPNRQTTFADTLGKKRVTKLDEIDKRIDWNPIREYLESIPSLKENRRGRPMYCALMLFKILLMQSWYRLSDPEMEEMLYERNSFMRFAGITIMDDVPDHSTIHRFRDKVAPYIDQLLELINFQLSSMGLIVREGTMVDASLVASAARPPRKGQVSSDPDARWGGKDKDKMTYGYKAHVGMDKDSELIRRVDLSPANEHDSQHFSSMVSGDEELVFADKGYFSAKNSAYLAERDIGDGIMLKAARGRPLRDRELDHNRFLSKIRSGVERFFGTMKRIYGFSRCRHFSLKRNRCHLVLICLCYNLKRSLKLSAL